MQSSRGRSTTSLGWPIKYQLRAVTRQQLGALNWGWRFIPALRKVMVYPFMGVVVYCGEFLCRWCLRHPSVLDHGANNTAPLLRHLGSRCVPLCRHSGHFWCVCQTPAVKLFRAWDCVMDRMNLTLESQLFWLLMLFSGSPSFSCPLNIHAHYPVEAFLKLSWISWISRCLFPGALS